MKGCAKCPTDLHFVYLIINLKFKKKLILKNKEIIFLFICINTFNILLSGRPNP